jgi:hypothetical protein
MFILKFEFMKKKCLVFTLLFSLVLTAYSESMTNAQRNAYDSKERLLKPFPKESDYSERFVWVLYVDGCYHLHYEIYADGFIVYEERIGGGSDWWVGSTIRCEYIDVIDEMC